VTRRLALLLVLVAAGCGTSAKQVTPTGPAPSVYHGFELKPPVAAPAFRLTDQAGRLVGPRTLRGHWFVVTFLYTHCPDVCPLIASNIATAMRSLPDLRALAVSVDPKGDTPAAVRSFVRAHRLPAGFRYLTGTRPQLAPVWKRYHIAVGPHPDETVDHSAFVVLVDPAGKERLLYDSTVQASELVADLRMLSAP